ncbi:MAG: BLUF domain-containing protein [Rhodocyclaceae bacterium]
MLVQVIYTSCVAEELDDAALAQILDVSVRNNSRLGITGLLVFAAGTFMQVLEGEDAQIDGLLARIHTDPRHRGVDVLVRNQIKEREFSQWHMGFRRPGTADAEALPQYAAFFDDGFDAGKIGAQPGMGLEILRALAGSVQPR